MTEEGPWSANVGDLPGQRSPQPPGEGPKGAAAPSLLNPEGVPTFGTVRVFCSDGYCVDTPLPVPWDQFIANMMNAGGLVFQNAFINRAFIVRIHRIDADGQPAGGLDLTNVTPLRPQS